MDIIRFITAQEVKDLSVIDDNVDNKYINEAIDMAMDKDLQQLIGSALYNAIYAEVLTANGVIASVTTAAYRTLLNKKDFVFFLKWSVLANGALYMTYKIQNKSIATKTSDNATPIPNYNIDKLVDEAKNNAQFYGQRVLYFIRDNLSDYPVFEDCDDIQAPAHAYKLPVFTGNKRLLGRRNNPNN